MWCIILSFSKIVLPLRNKTLNTMRLLNTLCTALLMLLIATLAISCEDDTPTPPNEETEQPEEKDDVVPEDAVPTVDVELTSVDSNSITVRLVSTNATELKWVCYVERTNAIRERRVLEEGTAAEPNKSIELVIDDLYAGTSYEIYAVARNRDNAPVISEKIVAQTPRPTLEATYVMDASTDVKPYIDAADNLRNEYLAFYDSENDYSLYIDLYTDASNSYLPSGVYPLGTLGAGVSYEQYSYFMPYSTAELIYFSEGSTTIASIEGSRAIHYIIDAHFTLTTGESVALYYSGIIATK